MGTLTSYIIEFRVVNKYISLETCPEVIILFFALIKYILGEKILLDVTSRYYRKIETNMKVLENKCQNLYNYIGIILKSMFILFSSEIRGEQKNLSCYFVIRAISIFKTSENTRTTENCIMYTW